jgi:hypothetical protein
VSYDISSMSLHLSLQLCYCWFKEYEDIWYVIVVSLRNMKTYDILLCCCCCCCCCCPFVNYLESEGEFEFELFRATYDDRFEWGLIHTSSGKFGIVYVICISLLVVRVRVWVRNLWRKKSCFILLLVHECVHIGLKWISTVTCSN